MIYMRWIFLLCHEIIRARTQSEPLLKRQNTLQKILLVMTEGAPPCEPHHWTETYQISVTPCCTPYNRPLTQVCAVHD